MGKVKNIVKKQVALFVIVPSIHLNSTYKSFLYSNSTSGSYPEKEVIWLFKQDMPENNLPSEKQAYKQGYLEGMRAESIQGYNEGSLQGYKDYNNHLKYTLISNLPYLLAQRFKEISKRKGLKIEYPNPMSIYKPYKQAYREGYEAGLQKNCEYNQSYKEGYINSLKVYHNGNDPQSVGLTAGLSEKQYNYEVNKSYKKYGKGNQESNKKMILIGGGVYMIYKLIDWSVKYGTE